MVKDRNAARIQGTSATILKTRVQFDTNSASVKVFLRFTPQVEEITSREGITALPSKDLAILVDR